MKLTKRAATSLFVFALLFGITNLTVQTNTQEQVWQQQYQLLQEFINPSAGSRVMSESSAGYSHALTSIFSTPLQPFPFRTLADQYNGQFVLMVSDERYLNDNDLKEVISSATGIPVDIIEFMRLEVEESYFPIKQIRVPFAIMLESSPDEVITRLQDDPESILANYTLEEVAEGIAIFEDELASRGITITVDYAFTVGQPANDSRNNRFFTASHGLFSVGASVHQFNPRTGQIGQMIGSVTRTTFSPATSTDFTEVTLATGNRIATPFTTPARFLITNFRGTAADGAVVHSFGPFSSRSYNGWYVDLSAHRHLVERGFRLAEMHPLHVIQSLEAVKSVTTYCILAKDL